MATRRSARAALIDAAAEVFAARGFADASVDEIAEHAGYSKGALYWHFDSKDDLFLALLEERIDRPTREMIELLETAPPERDMAAEGSRRLGELVDEQRDLLLLDNEYWIHAVRDPELRARYVQLRAELRVALGRALDARMRHLGAPPLGAAAGDLATIVMALATGLARHRMIEPDAARENLFGEAIVLLYRGLRAGGSA